MKFLNRKGETVDLNLSSNAEFKEPILALSGGGQSFVSTSMDDIKNLTKTKEHGQAILENAKTKFIIKLLNKLKGLV